MSFLFVSSVNGEALTNPAHSLCAGRTPLKIKNEVSKSVVSFVFIRAIRV